ncbi:MAG TPA: flagellar basal body-associated FliL family protein [Syntrophales bacterium]|nr:flagellar basal body-associated FliL family protein [Syntrophales bacterium]HOX93425.1 flagellar basal body-associated FliL family protein [Syntrophales bacterium]HPI56644.1 flagellar basal body-associated FliL family protein [Syntrophales bacterium]HPN24930.1 flagellar basal body-associated FliL family protein [Syntrophales bacterium]HQM29739.1 flagellar basal body-associated FliL family protein [Syntrophales bacterium]
MARNRKPDILDDDPIIDAGAGREGEGHSLPEEDTEDPSRGSFQQRLRRGFMQPAKTVSAAMSWVRHHRMQTCGTCGILLFLVVAVSVGMYLKGSRPDADPKKGAATPAMALQSVFSFENFTIDLKDPQGKYKLLICDVVLELNRPDVMTEEKKVVIRKTIYEAARKKSPDLLGSSQAHRVFKRQVSTALGSLMGQGVIRDVYVTKFVLL